MTATTDGRFESMHTLEASIFRRNFISIQEKARLYNEAARRDADQTIIGIFSSLSYINHKHSSNEEPEEDPNNKNYWSPRSRFSSIGLTSEEEN